MHFNTFALCIKKNLFLNYVTSYDMIMLHTRFHCSFVSTQRNIPNGRPNFPFKNGTTSFTPN